MAQRVFGLDFGTTNSLLSWVGGDKPFHFVDSKGRPHPSVVWYRPGETIVGREARNHLDASTDAIVGSFVRSPKWLLAQGSSIHIGGRDLDPSDIAADVLKFLVKDASERSLAEAQTPDRVVMTIPVSFDGAGRKRLRDAARKAGLGIVQFAHEPLAALYAFFRSRPDYRSMLSNLDGQHLLVFDWGGGTLDLTLCQVRRDQIVQVANLGDNEVGGDRFDEIMRNEIRTRHACTNSLEDLGGQERDEARVRLLNQCELAKIELSEHEEHGVFVRNYLNGDGPGRDLAVTVSRSDLDSWTRTLVGRGLGAIDHLLDANRLTPQQIALCLPTGGMVRMPAIRNGLTERFGARARHVANGDRIISEGAAWIAYDGLRLGLAKPIEILQSDDTYAAAVSLPFDLPVENQRIPVAQTIYHCVDPRPGHATFTFARPLTLNPRDARSDRRSYATLHLAIDEKAPPLRERLNLNIAIDHDYVVHINLRSTMRKHNVDAEIFDLEFTLRFPSAESTSRMEGVRDDDGSISQSEEPDRAGRVRLRSNVSKEESWGMVPGDLIDGYKPDWFDSRGTNFRDWQKEERDYYKECPYCQRTRFQFQTESCIKQNCLWRKAYPQPHR